MSPRRKVPRTEPYVYERMAAELLDMVAGLEDGGKLPVTLAQLAQRHGVSEAAARQAAREVEGAGLIELRHGAGMFARKPRRILRDAKRRLSREQWESGPGIQAADTGRASAVDRIEVTREEAPPPAASALGPVPVIVRRRRYVTDGQHVQAATSWIPASLAEGTRIAREDTGPGGVYARLAELGHGPVRFYEEVSARMPLPAERADLDLPRGRPVLEVTRRAYDAGGRVVEVAIMVMDAGAYVLGYDIEA